MDNKKPVKIESAVVRPPSIPETAFPLPFFRPFGRELEWVFNRLGFGPPAFEPREPFWTPDVEMFERNNTLIVRAELPGLKKEDVTVEVAENELVLKGERKHEKEEKGEGYYRSERSYGSFYRALSLPEGAKIDAAKATVSDGVLEVTMPMARIEARIRVLEIKEPAAAETEKASKHAA